MVRTVAMAIAKVAITAVMETESITITVSVPEVFLEHRPAKIIRTATETVRAVDLTVRADSTAVQTVRAVDLTVRADLTAVQTDRTVDLTVDQIRVEDRDLAAVRDLAVEDRDLEEHQLHLQFLNRKDLERRHLKAKNRFTTTARTKKSFLTKRNFTRRRQLLLQA